MAIAIGRNIGLKEASLLPARLALGSAMVYHGTSKLRGEGPNQTAQMFEQLGIHPSKAWAIATGLAESFAGVASILGIATRPAAIAVLVTQAVAIARVHGPKGYSSAKGGFEYNLALMAIATGLLVTGPGRISAYAALGRAVEGRGGRALLRRVRPSPLSRALQALR